MKILWAVNLIWAFSFSLIGVYLAGKVDGYFVVAARMALALLLFLPLMVIHYRRSDLKRIKQVVLIGTIQIGVMYLCLYHAFLYLSVAQTLLFTIMTPLYIIVLNAFISKSASRSATDKSCVNEKVSAKFGINLLIGLLAVLGGFLVRKTSVDGDFWTGLILVQLANLCFAFGQVAYKSLKPVGIKAHMADFGWFFVGALIVAVIGWILFGDTNKTPQDWTQWSIIVWLGLGASGGCYFAWNYAATLVSSGQLAVMNNILIPLGLAVNVFFWGQGSFSTEQMVGTFIIVMTLLLSSWIQRYSVRSKESD
jgi:drug/metabolite transporter (DMT)-like permease